MSQLGLGVMIRYLAGNAETVNAVKQSLGKEISSVRVEDNVLKFDFADGTKLSVWDGGQSCCEHRYMTSEKSDDLNYYAGSKLTNLETVSADPVSVEYGDHEIQFLNVTTDKGVFQVATHNEHNGYYGGFSIEAISS